MRKLAWKRFVHRIWKEYKAREREIKHLVRGHQEEVNEASGEIMELEARCASLEVDNPNPAPSF